eukprot:TRINITY_DN4372_c0_g1_i11.p1 TRINITY_DN4372_c0_g1~~TRINITY_DN4372_c0_g1_i11.p1  ORF type:complete len:126 (+),score=29.04 TRINITY_DN4372_c0_g1_i11:650-1027(+)
MITEHGITLHNGGIRTCYGPSGELYCLPMFVINPPEKFGSEKIAEDEKETGETITLKVIQSEKTIELQVQSNIKGKDFKKIVNEKMGNEQQKIRLFCVGQELDDKVALAKYKLADKYAVICYRCK